MSERDTFFLCQLIAAGATREQALQVIANQHAARESHRAAVTPTRTRIPATGPLEGKRQFHQKYRVSGSTSLRASALLS